MREVFKDIIIDERIEVNKSVYVDVEVFERVFEGAKSYDDFIKVDNGVKGYKRFFDKMKEQGILN